MNAVFLSSEYPPHTYGGLGTTVEALSRYLGRDGLEVALLVPGADDYAEPPAGVSLHLVPVEGAVSDEDHWLTYCESAVATARRADLRPDLVHCHDWMTALGGLAIGRSYGVPVLLSIHLPQTTAANVVLENLGIAGSDRVLVNSHAVCDELAAREPGDTPVSVIPNGVDLARFAPGDGSRIPHQVLYVGRLVPQKGVDVLLRAFGAVLHRHPTATLVVAGDGPQRLYLERLARFLGLGDRVNFLGWRPRGAVDSLYRTAAVTCVPSLYEPFGLVALEAMASGCPVVVGRVGGLAEIVDDEACGYTVEAGDHLDLATRVAALLSNPRLARAKGAAARRRAERYDWAIIAGRTAALYESLVASPARQAPLDQLDELLSTADAGLRRRAYALLAPTTTVSD